MSKYNLLQQYTNDVNNLRNCAKELNLTESDIDNIFKQCFNELNCDKHSTLKTVLKFLLLIACLSVIIYILLNVHQPTSSLVLRNVQGLIYPGLKVLRSLSVPVIKQFPFLTGLYDESCLIENPFFYVADMECWPCENVHSVIDLTGFNNHSLYDTGTPYITKTQQKQVFLEDLHQLYLENKQSFDSSFNHIKSTNSSIDTVQKIFDHDFDIFTHILWRINKMALARIIRDLYPKPHIISEWSGQSIERFLLIDGPKAKPYVVPNTECSYNIMIQSTGERTIVLKPSEECNGLCKTVSINLKPSYLLWYNWWYWRPISLPNENSQNISITYVSSYC